MNNIVSCFCPIDFSKNKDVVSANIMLVRGVSSVYNAIEVFLKGEGITLNFGLQSFIRKNILLVKGSFALAEHMDMIGIDDLQKIELYKISSLTDLNKEYAINLILN